MTLFTHGMDVSAVETMGRNLQDKHASAVNAVVNELGQLIDQTSSYWKGGDAERFRSWWPEKRQRLLAMADDLQGFGQSALNNVSAQRQASGERVSGGGSINSGQGVAVQTPSAPHAGGDSPEVQPIRDWREVQTEYDSWAYGRFAAGGVSHYQCTGWANFRWQQLGFDGEVDGHGGAMVANAPGQTTGEPSLHAMASYRSGEYGHVMIVEEISEDGSRMRVSEMNVGDNDYEVGRPNEYKDSRWYERGADGQFRAWNGNALEFAAFPGSSS